MGSGVLSRGQASVSRGRRLPDVFAGKSLIVLDNGPALSYPFSASNRLSLAEGDAGAVQAGYGALTLDRLALFSHLVPGTQRGIVVVDQETNLATVFEVWFSGYQDNREVQRQIAALFADASSARIDPGIRGLTAHGFGDQDVIDISEDRRTATGLIHCTVRVEAVIGPGCPLVDMARQQGGGVVARSEAGVFEKVYVRRDGVWKIQRSTYRPA